MTKRQKKTEQGKMADARVQTFKELYRKVYHERRNDLLTDYYRMQAELTVAGYRIEHSWGHYLTTPDGKTIILDDWNEDGWVLDK